jgi:hypothetical protein
MGYLTELQDPAAIAERFEAKTRRADDGCHEWLGYVGKTGYGRVKAEGRMWMAHRVAYIIAHGRIPDGMELDHLCRNRSCVNADHLEPVTKRENQLRSPISIIAKQVATTECPRGHSDYAVRCDGARVCRTCVRDRQRARRQAVA